MPTFQQQGIGNALIQHGLQHLQTHGAAGCVVLGEPDYYQRFGFQQRADCIFAGVPAEYFQVLAFTPHFATGIVNYHTAFAATSAD